MTVYVDLYFLLNFFLDFLSIWVCGRLLGYRQKSKRLALGALLGALYSLFALRFSSPLFMVLHLAFGALMLLTSLGYGSPRRFVRLCLLFYGVCFLLGGVITAMLRGIAHYQNKGKAVALLPVLVLLCAAAGAIFCLHFGKITFTYAENHNKEVTLRVGEKSLTFTGYADSGNLLREGGENLPVILANAALSRKIYALFTDKTPPKGGRMDPMAYEGMPLRVVALQTVAGKTILPSLRFENAEVDKETMCLCVALDFRRESDYCGFPALLPK